MTTASRTRALLVVTSHGRLGDTGRATGYYLPEVTHPYLALTDAGVAVNIASPRGGRAPLDPASSGKEDPANARFLASPADAARLEQTLRLAEVDPAGYRAVVFAGGHGTMWDFAGDRDIQRIAAAIDQAGGVVAALCHGPAALVNLTLPSGDHLVRGKNLTGFSNAEEQAAGLAEVVPFALETRLVERGAVYHRADLWQEKVVVDGRLVTGQNPASAAALGRAVAGLLV